MEEPPHIVQNTKPIHYRCVNMSFWTQKMQLNSQVKTDAINQLLRYKAVCLIHHHPPKCQKPNDAGGHKKPQSETIFS
jgi:hypothetical protein